MNCEGERRHEDKYILFIGILEEYQSSKSRKLKKIEHRKYWTKPLGANLQNAFLGEGLIKGRVSLRGVYSSSSHRKYYSDTVQG